MYSASGGTRRRAATRLDLKTGPFAVSVATSDRPLIDLLARFYGPILSPDPFRFRDFALTIDRPRGPRRWVRPQLVFHRDNDTPFEPFPASHGLPLFEWGLNFCVGTSAHQYLMLHAAVVEKAGRALIMPALPGSGKSTLCAALSHRGWRLLSDEFGLVRHEDAALVPMPRAIGLKNESIDVIREFLPEADIGPRFDKTRKGTVAHLAPPAEALTRQEAPARAAWIVFPRFRAGASLALEPQPKPLAFTRLANNAFNYQISGRKGFDSLTTIARHCEAYQLVYSRLDEALARLDALAAGEPAG